MFWIGLISGIAVAALIYFVLCTISLKLAGLTWRELLRNSELLAKASEDRTSVVVALNKETGDVIDTMVLEKNDG